MAKQILPTVEELSCREDRGCPYPIISTKPKEMEEIATQNFRGKIFGLGRVRILQSVKHKDQIFRCMLVYKNFGTGNISDLVWLIIDMASNYDKALNTTMSYNDALDSLNGYQLKFEKEVEEWCLDQIKAGNDIDVNALTFINSNAGYDIFNDSSVGARPSTEQVPYQYKVPDNSNEPPPYNNTAPTPGGSKRVGRKSRRNAKSKKLNKRKKSKQTKKRKTMKKKKRRV